MKLIKFAFNYILKYSLLFFLLVFFHIIKSLITIIVPYVSGIFIDSLLEKPTIKTIYLFIAIYIIICIAQVLTLYFSTILHTYVYSNSNINLTYSMINHMQKLPLTFYTNNKDYAYYIHRIQNDSNIVITFVLANTLDLISNVLSIAGTFYIILKTNKYMCVIFIITLIIYLLQYIFTKKLLYSSSENVREKESNFFSILLSQLKNLKLIKIYNVKKIFDLNLHSSYKKLYNTTLKLQKVMCFYQANQISAAAIFKVILLAFGGFQFINGNITIGLFSAMLSYSGIMMNSAIYFAGLGQSYVNASVSYHRLIEFLNIEEERNGSQIIKFINNIKLQELSYGYNDNLLIQNFNYTFEKGNIYCICGPNGIGKSTFSDILLGLNQHYEGEIIYNQTTNLRELDMYEVREQLCCYVSQDALLYEDTILNNILLGKENIDRKEVEEIAVKIGLFNINNSYLSLDYMIDNNKENLSGGEQQKISIIRSFIGKRDLIIYDEPTTYLDKISADFFVQKLKELKSQNKIVIVITHDTSLEKHCDTCINLKDFQIK